jgi:hypothetical protein
LPLLRNSAARSSGAGLYFFDGCVGIVGRDVFLRGRGETHKITTSP